MHELAGVEPNPRISTVRKGVELCKEHGIDFVLAVGGGSVIDATKAIVAGAKYKGDPWDLVIKKAPVEEALPFGTVLTIAATGSEANSRFCHNKLGNEREIWMGKSIGIIRNSPFWILKILFRFQKIKRSTEWSI